MEENKPDEHWKRNAIIQMITNYANRFPGSLAQAIPFNINIDRAFPIKSNVI